MSGISSKNLAVIINNLQIPFKYRRAIAYLVDHENLPMKDGYLIRDNGRFKGIAQFARQTWDDVLRRTPGPRYPFSKVYDIRTSLMMAYRHMLMNEKILRRKISIDRYDFAALMYLAHQQGAGGALFFLTRGKLMFPKQSRRSIIAHHRLAQGLTAYVPPFVKDVALA